MGNKYPYVKRAITARIKKLFNTFSAVVVSGARQVGKSTMLDHVFAGLPHIVFDPIQDIQNARQEPDLFLDNNPPPIILDEIQYAPELIPAIKRRIDHLQKPSLYLLTGSQQWGVLKNISESLAGRAALLDLEGFSLAEIAEVASEKTWLSLWLEDTQHFIHHNPSRLALPTSLIEQLWRGFLPETKFLDLDLIADFHASYQRTYIERDIRLLADVSDLQLFTRFVKLCAAHTAQEINYSKMGRDIGITPQTTKRWLNILTQAFEWFEIPAYANNAIKKISNKPKGYFADTGQVCFSQMISSPQALPSHPLWGAIFENAVVCELRKQMSLMPTPPRLYHWRVYSGAECDLVLERDGKFFPIEIKAKSQISRADVRGFQAFRQTHPNLNVQNGLVIAPVSTLYQVTEQDYVIPWDLH